MKVSYSQLILTLCVSVSFIYAQELEIRETDLPHATAEWTDISTGLTETPITGVIPMGTNIIRVTFSIVGDTITFTAVAKTLGYVGFGFTNSTGFSMDDADIFVAGLSGTGPYSKDYVSHGHVLPDEDTIVNWDLISASESGGETTIVFSRLLNTGDTKEDVKIEDKDMRIMWAIGESDTIDSHTTDNRGVTTYNLIQAPRFFSPLDPLPKSIPMSTDKLSITYSIVGKNITFQVIGQTRGYIGLGFNNGTAGGMDSSDIFIAWVNDDGSVGGVDTFANSTAPPINDAQQNWELLSGEEAGKVTRLVFTRLLVTTDDQSDIAIEDKSMRIVWAIGFDDFITNHGEGNMGEVSYNLISEANCVKGSWLLFNTFMILVAIRI